MLLIVRVLVLLFYSGYRVRKGSDVARLVFGMNQSLDGYVDDMAFVPGATLFRHFIEEAQGQAAVSTVARCMRSCVTGTTIIPNGMLGHGQPYFAGPRPPLRLMTNDRIGEDVIRLTYVPA